MGLVECSAGAGAVVFLWKVVGLVRNLVEIGWETFQLVGYVKHSGGTWMYYSNVLCVLV